MIVRRTAPSVLLLLLAASASFAMSSGPSNPPPQPGQQGMPGVSAPNGGQATARQEAEQSYALAYEEVARARKDIEDGKVKNAEKKFRRALERCEKAVTFDDSRKQAGEWLRHLSSQLSADQTAPKEQAKSSS